MSASWLVTAAILATAAGAPAPGPAPSAAPLSPTAAALWSAGGSGLLVGAGFGHAYAGEPASAIGLGVGEPLAIGVGMVLGMAVGAAGSQGDVNFCRAEDAAGMPCDHTTLLVTLTGAVLGAALYGGLAAWDAYQLVEARNRRQAAEAAP